MMLAEEPTHSATEWRDIGKKHFQQAEKSPDELVEAEKAFIEAKRLFEMARDDRGVEELNQYLIQTKTLMNLKQIESVNGNKYGPSAASESRAPKRNAGELPAVARKPAPGSNDNSAAVDDSPFGVSSIKRLAPAAPAFCEQCKGQGRIFGSAQCQRCNGIGHFPCEKVVVGVCGQCNGTGRIETFGFNGHISRGCGACGGTGKFQTPCLLCNGTGTRTCGPCGGTGNVPTERPCTCAAGRTTVERLNFQNLFETAKRGSPLDMFKLAQAYKFGIGCESDSRLAAEWTAKAAQRGYADAEFEMGALAESKPDLAEAKKWYAKAASKGVYGASEKLKQLTQDAGKPNGAQEDDLDRLPALKTDRRPAVSNPIPERPIVAPNETESNPLRVGLPGGPKLEFEGANVYYRDQSGKRISAPNGDYPMLDGAASITVRDGKHVILGGN
jgi:hypothetical protein